MDIVFIEELKASTVIGVYAWERRIRQTVSMDLDMACDIAASANSDDLTHTLSYKAVGKRVAEFVEAAEFELVEALAQAVAQLVMEEFNVPWLRLKLSKPRALTAAANVGVCIERGVRPA